MILKDSRLRTLLFSAKNSKVANDETRFRYYHKYKMLRSRQVYCKTSWFEIHMILCSRDFYNALWALKTFYYFSSLTPALIIHNDGSLTKTQKNIIKEHFKGVAIIDRAESDRKLRKELKDYRHCHRFRLGISMPLSIKLFDPYFYSNASHILLMDSDILFFQIPSEMLDLLTKKENFFISDYQDAYSYHQKALSIRFNLKLKRRLNTGLLFFSKQVYDFDLLERFLEYSDYHAHNKNSWMEQTCFALLYSKSGVISSRLSKNYQISFQKITERTACHHFVNNGSRLNFYSQGIKKLIKEGLLEKIKI